MATQEQAKKKIVAALLALRNILTRGPLEHYPFPNNIGDQHPEITELVSEIKRELAPHQAALDPYPPYFRDLLDCDVLTLNKLPADWETRQELDDYIAEFGGKKPKQKAIALQTEDVTILDLLAQGYPEATIQRDISSAVNITRRKVSERLAFLEKKKMVVRPEGTRRKGHSITPTGLTAINWPVDPAP